MYKRLRIAILLLTLCILAGQMLSVNITGYAAPLGKDRLSSFDKEKVQAAADQAVSEGLVGVSIAIYTPTDGMVLITSGESDRANHTKLLPTDISRIAS